MPGSTDFDQGRLNLCLEHATRFNRVCGAVVHLRMEERSKNRPTTASIHVMLRLHWLGPEADRYRSFIVRTAAFTASYTPRRTTGLAFNVMMGDILTGALERPHSTRNSTALAALGVGSLEEWARFAPYTVI